jgi:hypothetical protein
MHVATLAKTTQLGFDEDGLPRPYGSSRRGRFDLRRPLPLGQLWVDTAHRRAASGRMGVRSIAAIPVRARHSPRRQTRSSNPLSRVRAPKEGRGNEPMRFEFSLIAYLQARDRVIHHRRRDYDGQLHVAKAPAREAIAIARRDRSSASSLGRSARAPIDRGNNEDPAAIGVAQRALLIRFTSSKQHGTPLYRSSCARKPRPLFRADMFQPLGARQLVQRTAMCPRNPLACPQPSLELFDFR